MGPDFASLADKIAEQSPDMNIKVTTFTVSKEQKVLLYTILGLKTDYLCTYKINVHVP